MKKYVFEVIIEEGNDEFWEDITSRGVTGCDEVAEIVANTFSGEGWEPYIKLIRFEDK
jgi:hypothetical protein